MAANRLSSLNIILLVITLASVLLATYGFIQGGPRNRSNNVESNIADADDGRNPQPRDGAPVRDGRRPPDPKPVPPGHDGGNPGTPRPTPEPRVDADPVTPAPPPRGASNPSDSGNAAITGSVMDAGGKPVGGMAITARRSNFNEIMPYFDGIDAERFKSEMAQYLAAADRETRSTTTGSDGKFKFSGLDASLAYDIRAISTGSGGATASRVAAGDNVTLVLSLEGVLRGSVAGADGKPLTKFTISVSVNGQNWNQRRQTFNSADGSFSMTLPFGMRRVQASAPGLASAKAVEVTIDADGAEVALKLEAGAVLSGIVTDSGGKPLAEAAVTVQAVGGGDDDTIDLSRGMRRSRDRGGDAAFSVNVTTDSLGRYRIDSIPPGDYTATASYGEAKQEQKIALPAGETKQDFKLDSGVRVTIKLTDSGGGPIEPDNVWFQAANGGWGQAKRLPITERGLLEYAGLKAGQYTINITTAGYPQYSRKETLKEGILNQYEIKLSPGANISGTLTTTSGVSLGQGYQLRLRRDGEDDNAAWGQGRTVQLGADGSFKLGPVEAGDWTLEVMNQNWTAVHKEKITVTAGDNRIPLNVDAGGTLKLTVTTDDGTTAEWCEVTLTGAEGKRYNGWADAKGIATISFIAPGNYKITLNSPTGRSQSSDIYIRNGVNEQSLTVRAPNCIRVTSLTNDGQAKGAGMQVGDLLFEYNGKRCNNMQDIYKFVRETKDTESITVALDRNGQVITLNLKGGLMGITGEDAVR
ncbi:MAG: carboxypeptidase regulatory-like domain-containing protein [Planctomycetes bacterium]|nr:carboxypeptidase regulatory-like domain-containing protein [Planctomycetota bacterium]